MWWLSLTGFTGESVETAGRQEVRKRKSPRKIRSISVVYCELYKKTNLHRAVFLIYQIFFRTEKNPSYNSNSRNSKFSFSTSGQATTKNNLRHVWGFSKWLPPCCHHCLLQTLLHYRSMTWYNLFPAHPQIKAQLVIFHSNYKLPNFHNNDMNTE